MSRDVAKGDLERAIFERFAEDAGLVVQPQSVTQPDPPDILCDVQGLGHVAFELVQLDDTEELQRMGYLIPLFEDANSGLTSQRAYRLKSQSVTVGLRSMSNSTQSPTKRSDEPP
jgi:hypothetical protein